jgi:hypothetical protein
VKISSNPLGWMRVALFVLGTFSLWHMALFPQGEEPKKRPRRSLIFFGAFLATVVTAYMLGVMLGLWTPPPPSP